MKIYGLILAAGFSSRMGKLKALLPLDGCTVLSRCIRSLVNGGASDVFVVTGHKADQVGAEAKVLGMHEIFNPDYEQGMFSSVRAGVQGLPSDTAAFLVLPVDIPLVRSSTIRALTFDYASAPADIIYPCFRGERGHPPLISAKLIPEILAHDGKGGLRAVLERHDPNARELRMPDLGILRDLDTPEDYEQARAISRRRIPLPEECEALWELADTPHQTREHCKTVAEAACLMAEALNKTRNNKKILDLNVVKCAALMHDIAKLKRNHESAGAAILAGYGFSGIADIVAAHRDTDIKPDSPLTEQEIVFLADKLFQGTTPVSLDQRYGKTLERWKDDPEAVAAITGRLSRAKDLLQRYEQETGISIPCHLPRLMAKELV
ncbi:DVU_1551 family NTP transferase [Maridesulfovibrio salexigens]|uniref:Metal dependent phosphohydrolase n=1 Tax=Maridesulfovibrio salexigens (strain ATCC 14822 / DSM 2638 / NCIMB 8403 / VKM B-1763) TaxID=526222 RepID=C6BWB4_MARSD|nr:NTP transferase domain-containing protein [Maridesulfovibrio salexigens]ACS78358.1 metal dependent phosphohydrolase [Maridesulfovibrio salexigens DSM 2638]